MKKKKPITKKRIQDLRHRWEVNSYDLQVDMQNHFVIVEKRPKQKDSCVIQEFLEQDNERVNQDFQFGAVGTCPKKSPKPQ